MLFNEKEFIEFRADHPELRYWQALCVYVKVARIEVVYLEDEEFVHEDTFYWQDSK